MNPSTTKRIVIACGGTGGHFYPGYVLGATLRERGWETLFLLRDQDPAAEILGQKDIPFAEIALRGMPRSASLAWPRFAWQVLSSLKTSRDILRAFQPRCVAGMGGYLTFPAILAARWLKIPSLVHESNSVLGLANRACLPFVSQVALGLPLAKNLSCPDARFELTGTPVRPELRDLPQARTARLGLGLPPEKTTVLVFGGSQGAHGINKIAPSALRELAGKHPALQCLHLSGLKEEGEVRAAYAGAPFKSVVLGYTHEMHQAFAAADIVVSRAGASTLAELAAVRKPAVLIPFPTAAANHQEFNARLFERVGAALCLVEAGLTPQAMASALDSILSAQPGSKTSLGEMSKAYDRLGLPRPEQSIHALVDLVERTSGNI